MPPRFADEIAWWVWCCHHEGLRKIEPSLLRWAGQALSAAATEYRGQRRRPPASITDLESAAIVRAAMLVFEKRNARLPSAGARRNITHLVE
ncbi:tyrosine-type recombinase/integrase, partial [Mycobacterium kansasii]